MSLQLTVMSLDFDSLTPPVTKNFGKKEITIGRLPSNDLVLDTPEVSAHHAKLRVVVTGEKPRLFITDLGSTNGTLVENIPLADRVEIPLAANERVRIGNYLLKPLILGDEFDNEEAILSEKTFPEFKRNTEEMKASALSAVREQTVVMDKSELLKPLPDSNGQNGGQSLSNPDAHPVQAAAEVSSTATEGLSETKIEETKASETTSATATDGASTAPDATAAATDASALAARVTAKAGSAASLVFNFSATELFALKGKVLHKGTPLSGVSIDGGALGVTTTDSDGFFCFTNVAEGTPFDLKAAKPEYRITGSATGTLTKSEDISFEALQLFTVSGKISHQGKPLAGVIVDGGPLGKATTDEEGTYTFNEVLEDTEFSISVEKEGFRFATA